MISSKTPASIPCEACGVPVMHHGMIKLVTYDPSHRYKTSNKKFMMNYKWRLCSPHYEAVLKVIKKAVKEI